MAEEVEQYRKKLEGKSLPAEAQEEGDKQLKRLERSNPESAETAMVRKFADWNTGLPWGVSSQDNLELARARTILDGDHYRPEKPKERILRLPALRKPAPGANIVTVSHARAEPPSPRAHAQPGLASDTRPPFPCPPEPLRGLAVRAVTGALRRVDAGEPPNLMLRLLERMGLGFSS